MSLINRSIGGKCICYLSEVKTHSICINRKSKVLKCKNDWITMLTNSEDIKKQCEKHGLKYFNAPTKTNQMCQKCIQNDYTLVLPNEKMNLKTIHLFKGRKPIDSFTEF